MRHLVWLPLAWACADASAPAYQVSIEAWADGSYTLSAASSCTSFEQTMFGARSATCWSAKSKTEQVPAGSRLFPRFQIVVADYGSDDAAKARIGRFHETPSTDDLAAKDYPLRAGFRIGTRVVVVTTDAYAFATEVDQVAAALAQRMTGTELTCWKACAR